MLKIIFYLLIFFSLTLVLSKTTKVDDQTQSTYNGADLYRLNCSACHGLDRMGNPPIFPSLISINKHMTRERMEQQIRNGKNAMPPMRHLSDKEIEVILTFLVDNKDIDVTIDKKDIGPMLIASNCMRCHRVNSNDPELIEARMMEPHSLIRVVQWHNLEEFKIVLNTGPCYMPSFENMPDSDKEEIYQYLSKIVPDSTSTKISSLRRGCRMNQINREDNYGGGCCGSGR